MSLEAAIAREVPTYSHYNITAPPPPSPPQPQQQQQPPTSTPAAAQQQSRSSHSNAKHAPQAAKRSKTACCSRHSSTHTPTHQLVEQILHTVGELENTLIEDHQHDFDLRMAFERQTEKLHDLHSSLENERERNQRLMELIRGVDACSSAEEDAENFLGRGAGNQWQSRTSTEAYESISPLLMQQRYDELSVSYKQCRRQLARKEKLLKVNKCEKEQLQARYDHLFDEYRNQQKRFEDLCCKYLSLQAKKNQEIQRLRDALTFASDCVLNAQQILDQYEPPYHNDNENVDDDKNHNVHTKDIAEFRQNLQSFVRALRLCQWVQSSRRSHRPNGTAK